MLTEKDYCDYDTCVALSQLGCPMAKRGYLGLSLYSAQKWLREKKGIFVYIDVPWKTDGGLGWSHFCCNKPMTEKDKEVCFASGGFYDSYEEALSEGLRTSIKILKENETIHE